MAKVSQTTSPMRHAAMVKATAPPGPRAEDARDDGGNARAGRGGRDEERAGKDEDGGEIEHGAVSYRKTATGSTWWEREVEGS